MFVVDLDLESVDVTPSNEGLLILDHDRLGKGLDGIGYQIGLFAFMLMSFHACKPCR